jgi:hypothetical protein
MPINITQKANGSVNIYSHNIDNKPKELNSDNKPKKQNPGISTINKTIPYVSDADLVNMFQTSGWTRDHLMNN